MLRMFVENILHLHLIRSPVRQRQFSIESDGIYSQAEGTQMDVADRNREQRASNKEIIENCKKMAPAENEKSTIAINRKMTLIKFWKFGGNYVRVRKYIFSVYTIENRCLV